MKQTRRFFLKRKKNSFLMHPHLCFFSVMCNCSYTLTASKDQNTITTSLTSYEYSRNRATPSIVSMIKRAKLKRRVTIGSKPPLTGVVDDANPRGDESEWPPFADEDYIVFCFEEDGEFHVVTEETSRSRDCSEHGYSPSPSPNNLKVEEERFYFSPRLQSDGIRSSTRFKQEDDYEVDVDKARSRVVDDIECEAMDGVKNRGQLDEEEEDEEEDGIGDDDEIELRNTSMECLDGSIESTGSSQSEQENSLQLDEIPDEEMSGTLNKMVDDEESVYMSSESIQGGSQEDDDDDDDETQSGRESADANEKGMPEIEEEHSKEDEESDTSTTSSFEFPALQWEWNGSPANWPKPESKRFRKQKTRHLCLRFC